MCIRCWWLYGVVVVVGIQLHRITHQQAVEAVAALRWESLMWYLGRYCRLSLSVQRALLEVLVALLVLVPYCPAQEVLVQHLAQVVQVVREQPYPGFVARLRLLVALVGLAQGVTTKD